MNVSMAETIRLELRKGCYQMPGDTLPYETQAAKIAEQLAANGYGKLEETWDAGFTACALEHMKQRNDLEYPITRTNPHRTDGN